MVLSHFTPIQTGYRNISQNHMEIHGEKYVDNLPIICKEN